MSIITFVLFLSIDLYVIYITFHYTIYNCICVILKLFKFLLSLYYMFKKIIIAFIIFQNTVFTIILKSGKE